jgi:hypothetical protein
MEDLDATGVVFGARALLVGGDDVFVLERFETDEDAGAAGERHLADEVRIVGDVDGNGGAPNLSDRTQSATKPVEIIGPRAEVVVDKDAVRLAVGAKLGDDLLDVADEVRHVEAAGGEVAEAAAVVAAAGGDEAGVRKLRRGRISRRGAGSSR